GGDAVEMFHQQVAQLLHLGEPLPPQRFEPAEEKLGDAIPRLVRPEVIELFSEDVRLEQPAVRGEEGPQFLPLRPPYGPPAAEQQPALAAPESAHDGTGTKEFLSPDFVERLARVLQHVKLVQDNRGLRQLGGDGIEIRAMHVGADGLYG